MSICALIFAARGFRALLAAALLAAVGTTAAAPAVAAPAADAARSAARFIYSRAIPGHITQRRELWVGVADNQILVQGTAGRDIDCWVYDDDNNLVDADISTDATCRLGTPGVGVHRLVVENTSGANSFYSVWQSD